MEEGTERVIEQIPTPSQHKVAAVPINKWSVKSQLFLWLTLLACQLLYAQSLQVITSQGGDATYTMGQLQWTLGETFIAKNEANDAFAYSIYEGMQQGQYVAADASIREKIVDTSTESTLRYYPNPVVKYLTIEDMERLVNKVVMYDAAGNQVYERTRSEQSQLLRINMDTLPTGIYFVRLYDNAGSLLKRFRVVRQGR